MIGRVCSDSIRYGTALSRQSGAVIQLLVERVDVQEHTLEVRIRAEGLTSLVAELRQRPEQTARAA
jgi:hypothetical protein